MIIVSYGLSATILIFLDPILSVHLHKLGVKDNHTALAFATVGLTYTIGSLIIGALSEKCN